MLIIYSYAHGSPYKDGRHIVLNEAILKRIQSSNAPFKRITPGASLRVEFLKQLRKDCREAKAAGERLLVLLCGHGAPKTSSFYFGKGEWQNMRPASFISALGINDENKDLPVMLISTACYSGAWITPASHNISGMTASGAKEETHSWRFSGSTGRACGTMFVSGVADKLANGLQSQIESEAQFETFTELV